MTGNRRIIPISIEAIDFDLINSIDRDELWGEVYHLFQSGYDTDLTKDEIKLLNEKSEDYSVKYSEEELIMMCYKKPEDGFGEIEFLNATEILNDLNFNFSVNSLTKKRVGQTMKKLGFEQESKRGDWTGVKRGYEVVINSKHVKRG